MAINVSTIVDVAAYSTVIGTLIGYLPELAALMSVIWIGIQIYAYFKNKDK